MLYQTHHTFLFQFKDPYTLSTLHPSATPAPSLPLLSSPPVHLKVETEMECVEAALKTSFRQEVATKLSPRADLDNLLAVNGQNGVSGDEFFVDDLFDFSNEEDPAEEKPKTEDEDEEEKGRASVSSTEQRQEDNIFSEGTNFESLAVPADDLADLEWLSHFVEDSFSEYSAPFSAGILPANPKNHTETRPSLTESTKPCFTTPVPAKARSKRTRSGGRVWSLGSPSLSDSSSSSTSSSSCSSPFSPWLVFADPVCSIERPRAKKPKKKPVLGEGTGSGGAQPPRRCSHCGVQKTPQWRTGPLGAKTLCNACGVRFKSGRLLPEYRPACSPTFSSELHSNNHRKVLEMRRKKEEPVSDFGPPVLCSF